MSESKNRFEKNLLVVKEKQSQERKALQDIAEKSPFEIRSCYDCGHLKAVINWWCGNKEAIAYRGTAIPGCRNCPYWKPDWSMIKEKYKTRENGYIKQTSFIKRLLFISLKRLGIKFKDGVQ
jgi:hypothetical protein